VPHLIIRLIIQTIRRDRSGPVWIRPDRRGLQREQARSVWSRPDRRRAPGYGSGGWGFESLAAVNDSPEIRIVYADIDLVTGRRRQVARQVKGKREAERLEAQLRAGVADGRHRRTSARTVAELLDVYLAWRDTSGRPLSPATLNDYRTIVEAKLKPALGKLRLSQLDPVTLDRFYSQLRLAAAATTRPRSAPAGYGRFTPWCRGR
jgi:hypothetical protein